MSILVDTNVLTRLALQSHPSHHTAETVVSTLRRNGERLCIVPQNLYEFQAVSTRPVIKEYGLGMTVEQVVVELARLKSLFVLLPDNVAVYEQWEQLVIQHKTKGKHSHDVRLIAAMKAHGLTRILTFDRDFEGYSEIAVVNPQSAEAGGTRT